MFTRFVFGKIYDCLNIKLKGQCKEVRQKHLGTQNRMY